MLINPKALNEAAKVYHDGSYCGHAAKHLKAIIEAYEAAKAAEQPDESPEGFVVKHYVDAPHPTIKFDGGYIEVHGDREDAEDFLKAIYNAALKATTVRESDDDFKSGYFQAMRHLFIKWRSERCMETRQADRWTWAILCQYMDEQCGVKDESYDGMDKFFGLEPEEDSTPSSYRGCHLEPNG